MKKYLALLLIAAMMLTFVACNNGGNEEATTVGEGEGTAEPTGEAATEAATDPAQATEAPTEEATEANQPTEADTTAEEPTEAPTEEATEAPTDAPEVPTEPAETEPADGIYDTAADKACFAAKSFDECEAWQGETELNKFFAPGAAASCPEIVDVAGEATAVRFWGWLGTTQDIATLGYRIDDAKPVFSEEWFFDAEGPVADAVAGAGGSFATRFRLFADISEGVIGSGEHTVTALYKLADGTVVAFASVKINVGYRKVALGNTAVNFVSDVASQTNDFANCDLSTLFTMELPINQCGIGDGIYNFAGICDFLAKMDGQFAVTLKDFWCQGPQGAYFFVRGTKVVHSADVPSAGEYDYNGGKITCYPINNYYETDGHPEGNSTGGSGVCVSLTDGVLTVTVKYFDPDYPSKVGNARFSYAVDSADITIVDDNNNIYIYAGSKLVVTVALEGSVAVDTYTGVNITEDVHFAKKATLTGADGSVNVVENTLAVDNAASDIGVAARAMTVRFSALNVTAPFVATDKAADPDFKHVSPDDIRLTVDVKTLGLYAWGWVAVNKEIECFGYQLDNNLPVWSDAWTVAAEQGVVNAAASVGASYSSRFKIDETVENAAFGEHTVKYLVKFTDGSVDVFQTKTAMVLRDIISAEDEAACNVNVSFDELDGWTNGAQGPSAFVPGQSKTWDHICNIEKNTFDQLRVWGWVGCSAPLDLTGFGYVINNSVYRVYNDAFAFETEQPVIDAALSMGGIAEGASRFKIFIDVAGLDVGEYPVQCFYTLADGTIVEICAFTLKVSAPIEAPKYIVTSADAFNSNANCTVENEEGEYGACVVILATGDDPHTNFAIVPEMTGSKVVALKYRTTSATGGEFFVGTGAGAHGGSDEVKFAYNGDGEWNTLLIDLTTSGDWGDQLGYIRYDFFPGNDGAIRIAYAAFCANMQDAQAYAAAN